MENQLIKITTNEEGKQLVSARELYLGLGMDRSQWSRWNKKNIVSNEYFAENTDWIGVRLDVEGNEVQDFAISLEFAKHLAMMSRTPKSNDYRNYFIACEKQLQEVNMKANLLLSIYNGGQDGILAAKQLSEIEKKPLLDKIEEQKPMVEFVESITESSDSIDVGQFAKLIKDEGIKLGRNKLFDWMRDNGYLRNNNEPYQRYIDNNIFETKEYTYKTPYGMKIGIKTLITGKGQIYFVEKLRKEI